MRYHTTAEEALISPTVTIRWPAAAQAALAPLLLPTGKHYKEKPGLDQAVVKSVDSAAWEWDLDTIEKIDEDGQRDDIEVRSDLILMDSESQRIERQFNFLTRVCEGFGIPADLSLRLADGSERFAQTRPLENSPRARRGLAIERSDEDPQISLKEALDLAMRLGSADDIRQALRETLDERLSSQSVEESLPAFEALWPGDSFDSAARLFALIHSPKGLCAEAAEPLLKRAPDGSSPIDFFARSDPWSPFRYQAIGESLDALAGQCRGEAQALVLEALADRLLRCDDGMIHYTAEPFLTALCERFECGEWIDFSGAVGQLLNANMPEGNNRSGKESLERARLEALFLKAQTLPFTQERRLEAGDPPPARAIRV